MPAGLAAKVFIEASQMIVDERKERGYTVV
jgi:hypothetical protein